ncbi:unnamed protein product [Camellia sinensis]
MLLWASSVISGTELTVVLFSNRNNGEQRTISSADESIAMGPLPNVELHSSNNGEQRYLTSRVYEHITYDNETHISLASLSGMQRRNIITSFLSKVLQDYESRRNYTIKLLAGVGFQVQFKPQA